jgi:hypothetical protein
MFTQHTTHTGSFPVSGVFRTRMVDGTQVGVTIVWLARVSAHSPHGTRMLLYLYLMSVFLVVSLVWCRLNPMCPAITQGRIILDPPLLQFESEVCVNREDKTIDPPATDVHKHRNNVNA